MVILFLLQLSQHTCKSRHKQFLVSLRQFCACLGVEKRNKHPSRCRLKAQRQTAWSSTERPSQSKSRVPRRESCHRISSLVVRPLMQIHSTRHGHLSYILDHTALLENHPRLDWVVYVFFINHRDRLSQFEKLSSIFSVSFRNIMQLL